MPPLLPQLVLVAGLVFMLCQCVVFGLWMLTALAAEGPFPRAVLGMLVTGGVVIAWFLMPLAGFDRHRPPAQGALHIVLHEDRPRLGEERAVPPEPHGRGEQRDGQGQRGRDDVDLSGEWLMINTVWDTQYAAYTNLQLGFRLSIWQQGQTFAATGEKYLENGRPLPPAARRPITLQGTLMAGGGIEATFQEAGLRRQTTGRLQLTRHDPQHLRGTFHSTAAGSSGSSQWILVR